MIDDNEFSLSHVTRQFRTLIMELTYQTGNTLCQSKHNDKTMHTAE